MTDVIDAMRDRMEQHRREGRTLHRVRVSPMVYQLLEGETEKLRRKVVPEDADKIALDGVVVEKDPDLTAMEEDDD